MGRISIDGFSPIDIGIIGIITDILNVRSRTEAVVERIFTVDKREFHFIDVAGQKDRRNRWASFFEENLSAIIFVAAVSAFDQTLVEDPDTNRFFDSMVLFESLMNNKMLKTISAIVLLNKADLFKKKCKILNFQKFIPHYQGIMRWLIKARIILKILCNSV